MGTGTGNGNEAGRVWMRGRKWISRARIGMWYVTEACCDVVQFAVRERGGEHVTGSGQVECLAMMGRAEEPARVREA